MIDQSSRFGPRQSVATVTTIAQLRFGDPGYDEIRWSDWAFKRMQNFQEDLTSVADSKAETSRDRQPMSDSEST
jgi:hypothetical protein